jgi:hypothetical protein
MYKWKIQILAVFCFLLSSVLEARDTTAYKIQIAFLLDASGSMEGLITQAQGQIWSMSETLLLARKEDKPVQTEFAVISYGNTYDDPLFFSTVHSEFSTNLDSLAEALLEIEVNGGDECCGAVIQQSLDVLNWSKSPGDLKLIFIAGNEPFDQCLTSYQLAIQNAIDKHIMVNTLFCGYPGQPESLLWIQAAEISKGQFIAIETDSIAKYSETFWDDKIIELNDRLNETIVPTRNEGDSLYRKMVHIDEMTQWLGKNVMRQRIAYKSKFSMDQINWDLVNQFRLNPAIVFETDRIAWPQNLYNMSPPQREVYLRKKYMQRSTYMESIELYSIKAEEQSEILVGDEFKDRRLDKAVLDCAKKQGERQGFSFEIH